MGVKLPLKIERMALPASGTIFRITGGFLYVFLGSAHVQKLMI
jgi:hypothetical protein